MQIFQLLQCARGKHVRSKSSAWYDGDTMRSVCRGCGKPMRRVRITWVVEDAEDAAGAPGAG